MNGTEPRTGEVTRILLLDEHPFIREGIRAFIDRQADLEVCFDTAEINAALQAIEQFHPHLVMAEVRLANGDMLEFIKTLKARFPLIRILIVSQFDESFYAERALRAGAHGYMMKHEPSLEVLLAIRKVMKGELYVSRTMASSLLSKLLQAPAAYTPRQMEGLSDREFQVFHMLGAGLGSRAIAERLKLSIKTIETYRENIKRKFGLRTSAELLRHAAQWLQEKENRLPMAQAALASPNSESTPLRVLGG
jgi:DNA-binding NarL/FixJ family response regulator